MTALNRWHWRVTALDGAVRESPLQYEFRLDHLFLPASDECHPGMHFLTLLWDDPRPGMGQEHKREHSVTEGFCDGPAVVRSVFWTETIADDLTVEVSLAGDPRVEGSQFRVSFRNGEHDWRVMPIDPANPRYSEIVPA